MKKIIYLLIVAVVISVSYFAYRIYVPRIVAENSYPVLSCSDTDGRDIYVKGYTNFERDEPGQSNRYEYPDTCEIHPQAKADVLREGWCEGNVYQEIKTTCGYGRSCVDGACI